MVSGAQRLLGEQKKQQQQQTSPAPFQESMESGSPGDTSRDRETQPFLQLAAKAHGTKTRYRSDVGELCAPNVWPRQKRHDEALESKNWFRSGSLTLGSSSVVRLRYPIVVVLVPSVFSESATVVLIPRAGSTKIEKN